MSAPAASLDQVLGDPHWFADGFEPASGIVGFTEVSREELAAQPFLDLRWDRAGHRRGGAHLSRIAEALDGKPDARDLGFIWHTGFCCSTLLAQALDSPGRNLSLCEPKLLVDVADAKRAGAFGMHPDLVKLPKVAFALLSRAFGSCEKVMLKPAPAANHLLQAAGALTGSRHLLLFSDCESFVISAARMGPPGEEYARAMLAVLERDGIAPEWSGARTKKLTLLQTAALVWHLQIAEFRANNSAVSSLDCDALLDNPSAALLAVDSFLGLGIGKDRIAKIVSGPLFRRNAKNPGMTFDSERRRAEHAAARQKMGNELRDAVTWSYDAFGGTPRGYPLPDPLISPKKAYA